MLTRKSYFGKSFEVPQLGYLLGWNIYFILSAFKEKLLKVKRSKMFDALLTKRQIQWFDFLQCCDRFHGRID